MLGFEPTLHFYAERLTSSVTAATDYALQIKDNLLIAHNELDLAQCDYKKFTNHSHCSLGAQIQRQLHHRGESVLIKEIAVVVFVVGLVGLCGLNR